ncbi:hypothetical protein HID58_080340 [Brassica napus]|uniref:Uncharacterized protein n=1 Tax=Brassica napus TaxID=3708 RepID=A0ABQ7Y5Z0_BRANA|nr:hypothetical protein HID58_080340 [Brassica napus]
MVTPREIAKAPVSFDSTKTQSAVNFSPALISIAKPPTESHLFTFSNRESPQPCLPQPRLDHPLLSQPHFTQPHFTHTPTPVSTLHPTTCFLSTLPSTILHPTTIHQTTFQRTKLHQPK